MAVPLVVCGNCNSHETLHRFLGATERPTWMNHAAFLTIDDQLDPSCQPERLNQL